MKKCLKALTLFVFAMVLTLTSTIVVSCGKEKDETTFVDQGEVGKYYAFNKDGETVIELNENAFTFTSTSETLKGSYTFDGTKLVLKFEGDETGVSVKYNNLTMSFVYKGNSYLLYRQVNYVMSFESNGGSSVQSINVQNGKNAVKPANPVKEGFTFIGWYKDSKFESAYDFNSEIVTKDIKLYARFEENTNPEDEVVVQFSTGLEEVTFADVTTFHNTLYTLPVIEGKDFIGWWMSDYNDSNKLSRQFNVGMELAEDTVLFAVYKDNLPKVSVKDGIIEWNSLGVGKQYAINIKDADHMDFDPIYSVSISDTYLNFNFDNQLCGNYVIEVTSGNYTGRAYIKNKALGNVKAYVEGTKVKWNPVQYADKYVISVLCGTKDHRHENIDLGSACEFDFSECDMRDGGIEFVITAKADYMMDSKPCTVNCYRELAEVTAVNFDAATQDLTWNAIEDATGYNVVLEISGGQKYNYSVNENKLNIANFYGELNISITPIKKGYMSKTFTEDYNKTSLTTPKNVMVVGYDVMWDAVVDAVSYNVLVGNKSYTALTNNLELDADEYDGVDEFRIKVQAVAADAVNNSLYSVETVITKDGVNQITYSNGVIAWNSNAGVIKYAVKVDDNDVIIVSNKANVEYNIPAGLHKIYVATCDNDGNYDATKFFNVDIEVFALVFDTLGGSDVESFYYMTGDTIDALPDASYEGYTFAGWYDAPTNGQLFTENVFNYSANKTVYAYWTPNKYVVTLNLAGFGEGEDDKQIEVYFGNDFKFEVPASNNPLKAFSGWYSEKNAQGEKYTNEFGDSIRGWRDFNDVTIYAGWVDIYSFTLINNNTEYAVAKGPGIGYVTEITIPYTFNELPVTTIEVSAFQSCTKLLAVNIPNTIKNVNVGIDGPNGTGSCFQSCSSLQAVNVYEVEGAVEEDVQYLSIDGVLIHKNGFNGTEIAFVPYYTKNGVYTIPSIVDTIPVNAFKSCSKITELIIPTTVKRIQKGAFSSMIGLVKVTFLEPEESETAVTLEFGEEVFKSCSKLVEVNLPARMDSFNVNTFASCSVLERVNILGECEGQKFTSLDGIILNADKTTILFVPRAFDGEDGTYQIPGGVRTIAESAFESNKVIEKLIISAQVRLIEKNAFKSCTGITELQFLGVADDNQLTICESAFYGCTGLTSLVLPENLLKMEVNAFGGTTKLTEVTVLAVSENIDFAIASFGSTAATPVFYVTDLNIGAQVSPFDVTGVFGSLKLVNVNVAEGNANYTSIDGVLYDSKVTQVLYYPKEKYGDYQLPDTIKYIGARVFQEREGITTITINPYVTEIGEGAFQKCTGLTTLIFQDTPEGEDVVELVIGKEAFLNCTGLTSIVFPTRLRRIEDSAFKQCRNITAINIPEGVKYIGPECFNQVNRATVINLPSTVEVIAANESTTTNDTASRVRVFDYVTDCTSINVAEGNAKYASVNGVLYEKTEVTDESDNTYTTLTLLVCPVNYPGKLDIPANVTKIQNRAFINNKGVTEVTFSNGSAYGLTIGEWAFYWSEALTKVTLPTGLSEISQNAFYYCQLLTEITIPNTVKLIGTKAFQSCAKLERVIFEEGGTEPLTIDDGTMESSQYGTYYYGAFYNCSLLEEMILPERTVKIGKYSLSQLPNLTKVVLPSTLREIGEKAFYQDAKLNDLTFSGTSSSLSTIGNYAFQETGITSFVVHEGITALGKYMFYNCKQLETVSLPSTVKEIPTYAFYSCNNLKTVTLAEGCQLELIGDYAFQSCKSLTSFVVPATVTTIGGSAFRYCSNLSSFTFEEGENGSALKTIGTYVWQETAITSFRFPYCGKTDDVLNTITIGTTSVSGVVTAHLFQGCKYLTDVYISESVANITNIFTKCGSIKNITISGNSENFSVSEGSPIILSKDGKAIKFSYGEISGDLIIPDGVTSIGSHAFDSQVSLTKVSVPKTLKTIDEYAFYNCIGLTEFNFADGCVCDTIGQYAFENCHNLTSFNMPNTIETIGKYAFCQCYGLEEVKFSTSLTTIGDSAFAHCRSLKELNLPASLQSCGTSNSAYTFAYCNSLTEVTLPNGLVTPGGYMLAYCESLEKVWIPNTIDYSSNANYMFKGSPLKEVVFEGGITTLGNYMFDECKELKTVTLPDGLEYMGTYTFRNSGLESIIIPDSVIAIGNNAYNSTGYVFDGCENLSSVTMGTAVETIGQYAFRGCKSLKSIALPESLTKICLYAFSESGLESIVIPKNVTALGVATNATTKLTVSSTSYAFSGCADLKSVTFEGDLTFIGCNAFAGTTSLESFVVPTTVQIVGNYAFQNSGVISATIMNSSTTLGTYLFDGCTRLEDVTLDDKFTTLPNYCFRGCTSLKGIKLPTSLTTIGTYTFQNSGLETISIPKNCLKLPTSSATAATAGYTFDGCENLTTVVFEGNTTIIGGYMFRGCKSLVDITLPSTLTGIGTYCFQNCTSLKNIAFPNTVTTLGGTSATGSSYIFDGCTSLENVTLSTKMTSITGYAFRNCTSLKSITLPTTVTNIVQYAFYGAGLESIDLPKVTTIGNYAFYNSNLTTFTLNASATSIGNYAFTNSKLTSAQLGAKLTKIGYAAFNGCPDLATVTIDAANTKYYVYDNCAIVTTAGAITSVFNCTGKDFIIPDNATIDNYAFAYCNPINSITLPSTMTTTGTYGFYYANIKEVILPDSIDTIGNYMFRYSTIEKIVLGNNNITLGSYVFADSDISEVVNSENIIKIGTYAFLNCLNLKQISLGDNLTEISSYGFKASGITSIDVPASVEWLGTSSTTVGPTTGGYVFQLCADLETITLHEGLKYILGYAFSESAVKNLVIPSSAEIVGNYLCKNCLNLETVEYKSSAVSTYLFTGCEKLTSITIDSELTELGNFMFQNCTLLSNIVLPNTLEVIGQRAFDGCTSLETITLPESVNTINTYAFAASGLKAIEIPSGVTMLGTYAFANCTNLETVVLHEGLEVLGSTTTTIGGNPSGYVFQNCTNLKNITLPKSLTSIGSNTFEGCTSISSLVIPETCTFMGRQAFAGWTADQTILVEASRYDITGNWYENFTYNSYNKTFAEDCNAVIVFSFVEE